ncbi:hypothetical protein DLE60_14710 [Micromonospora globispora]|uniref:DUF8083 domain-containing protein n=1 Tax=Micromonospora globispora TaxID=1450148 RepID=A0A317JVE5_9ACTN|nr:hypothetical protein [Micromonospora globispora]PWU44625.1 hypothetical protein DLJ46_25010 [Micromonospora globispora]PWU59763.1 hypothetical protein DLE60_14710 [Micromonospora globispora]RQW90828.1 hypothetical protein DKL51_22200 [Micromonospora globispora]
MPSLFASYLRVYEPLTAFDRDRQSYWRRYVNEGRAIAPLEGPVRQRTAVIEALGAGWTRLPDLPDEAYVLETDDTLLVCPWNLRIRVAEAALSARDGVPSVLADAFVPPILAGQAKAVVEDWRSGARVLEHGVPRVHEQIATWGVPLRWFVLFESAERHFVTDPARRALRYRTEISKARRRSSRALSVLRKSVGEAPITEAVEEAARWLEEFHPRSVVELDYGGLVQLLPDETLAADDSTDLVATGLAGLSRGEAEEASAAYDKLVARWRAVQLLERCN